MLKGFKYRIYPTKLQSDLINRHIGASRFLYNLALETKESAFNGNKYYISEFDMINQLPDLKKELPWLKEICATSLQQSIKHLYAAYKNFVFANSFLWKICKIISLSQK